MTQYPWPCPPAFQQPPPAQTTLPHSHPQPFPHPQPCTSTAIANPTTLLFTVPFLRRSTGSRTTHSPSLSHTPTYSTHHSTNVPQPSRTDTAFSGAPLPFPYSYSAFPNHDRQFHPCADPPFQCPPGFADKPQREQLRFFVEPSRIHCPHPCRHLNVSNLQDFQAQL